jgi:hypothetical protein
MDARIRASMSFNAFPGVPNKREESSPDPIADLKMVAEQLAQRKPTGDVEDAGTDEFNIVAGPELKETLQQVAPGREEEPL